VSALDPDSAFLDAVRRSPRATALVDADARDTWTYERLGAAACRAADRFRQPRKGVVLWISRTSAESVAAYLGILASGHAALPVPHDQPEPQLERLLAIYRPELAVSLPEDALPGSAGAEYVREPLDVGGPRALQVWRRQQPAQGDVHAELALLLSTSGSTGTPKMARLSQRNLESNARSIALALAIDDRECAIASLPFHYSYGLSVLHSHLLAGARLVLTQRSPLEADFWRAIAEHGCTSLAGVPHTYSILRRLGFAKTAPACLVTLTQAGGKMSPDLIREFSAIMKSRGGRLYVMYGQTEATARMTVLPPDRVDEKLGGVGFPIDGGAIEIRRPDPSAREGEVVYRGPNVMLGYAESRGDLARGDENQGVLETGDLGYLDPDGCLFITGRLKRFAKVFGLRVSLDDIEARLAPHGTVAATGDDHIAVFTPHACADAVRAALGALARELQIHPSAFRLRALDELPLLPSGKVDYAQLSRSEAG
jgi:acyl-CoA synthetase (AMP-forming)/AMP-acid ligase II